MPDGTWVPLQRRGRTFWLKGEVDANENPEVVTVAAVRRSPEAKTLPFAAEEAEPRDTPGGASSADTTPPMAKSGASPGAQQASDTVEDNELDVDGHELSREKDGQQLAIAQEAQRARARGIPVMPPLAERPLHRLIHLPYRAWCKHCVVGRGRDNAHPRKVSKERRTPSGMD